jgi:hypothetical protein
MASRVSAQIQATAAQNRECQKPLLWRSSPLFRCTGLCLNQLRSRGFQVLAKKLVVKPAAFSYLFQQPHLSGAGADWICPRMHVQKPYNRKQLTSEEPDEV